MAQSDWKADIGPSELDRIQILIWLKYFDWTLKNQIKEKKNVAM